MKKRSFGKKGFLQFKNIFLTLLPKPFRKGFFLISAFVLFLSLFLFQYFYTQLGKSAAQTSSEFSFGVAGDMGANTNTSGVFNSIPSQALSFFFGLGDLSYNQVTPEASWCDYVKSRVGAEFPFQLVAGNHEDNGPDGQIANFASCLPNRMLNIVGTYPKEYYFDYPPVSPIARFILISPGLSFPDEGTYSYNTGNARYNWTAAAIDSARAAGIKWVVVGMHKYCISMQTGSCEVGANIVNLLIQKKVDMYLQAHDHAYARSKQLALNPTNCTSLVPNSYNANCVVDDGSDNQYTKAAGTIFMTVGSGGGSMNKQYTTDSEAGYFAKWMGTNFTPTYGFMKFTVSNSQILAQFIKGQGSTGSFIESFSITDPTASASASPSPSDVATPSPLASPSDLPTATPTPTPSPSPSSAPSPSSSGATSTVTAIADAFVASDTPTTNFGTTIALYVDGSPVKVSYLKFDLSSFAGLSLVSAKLRIRTTSGSFSGSPDTHVVKLVGDASWSESGLNYNNRPVLLNTLGSVSNTLANTFYEISLTPGYIQPSLGSLLSLGIDSVGGDAFYFNSKEAVDGAQLILNF